MTLLTVEASVRLPVLRLARNELVRAGNGGEQLAVNADVANTDSFGSSCEASANAGAERCFSAFFSTVDGMGLFVMGSDVLNAGMPGL